MAGAIEESRTGSLEQNPGGVSLDVVAGPHPKVLQRSENVVSAAGDRPVREIGEAGEGVELESVAEIDGDRSVIGERSLGSHIQGAAGWTVRDDVAIVYKVEYAATAESARALDGYLIVECLAVPGSLDTCR